MGGEICTTNYCNVHAFSWVGEISTPHILIQLTFVLELNEYPSKLYFKNIHIIISYSFGLFLHETTIGKLIGAQSKNLKQKFCYADGNGGRDPLPASIPTISPYHLKPILMDIY